MENEKLTLRSVRQLTRKEKLKISELYLKKSLKPSEICEEFGLDGQSLRSYLYIHGLTAKRKELDDLENQQLEQKSHQIADFKTSRQLSFYGNLQERSETLTEKALDMANDAEGASELNTALGAVKTAVNLFEQSSINLGESIVNEQVKESGNQYNFFFADSEQAREAIKEIRNSVQKDSRKPSDSGDVIDIE